MHTDTASCYQALLTHDPRFDGVFFVGVSTTGIYCRTVCPAKTPRLENCRFYPSASAAEGAGFRPCLRCRPELAPGLARIDSISRLAASLSSRIEDGALIDGSVAGLAEELGVSDRHLRRIAESEFGVSPVALAQTHRLLLAKRLLTDTHLPIGEVAFASGFTSVRRFNALFQSRYRLSPTQLRRGRLETGASQRIVCEIRYHPPFAWTEMLSFLAARCSAGAESVDGNRYLQTVRLGKHSGWITVEPSSVNETLLVTLSVSLATVLSQVLCRVKRLFDLNAEPSAIASHLGSLAAGCPGRRVPGAFDGFSVSVRAILGQQISVKAATTLAGRLTAGFGDLIDTPYPALTHLPPTPEQLARAKPSELAAIGVTSYRAHSLSSLACAVSTGALTLDPGADVKQTVQKLMALPGIGSWTAQYIAMRALGWPDAFPHTDLALMKAMGERNPKRMLEISAAWSPWRSYAAMHLWHTQTVQKETTQ